MYKSLFKYFLKRHGSELGRETRIKLFFVRYREYQERQNAIMSSENASAESDGRIISQ